MSKGARAQLTITCPGSPPRSFLLREGRRLTVGRGSSVDMALDDPAVSRNHAHFELRDASVFICDDGSRNGVLIDGSLLEPGRPHSIEAGQRIRIADATIEVRVLGAQESSVVVAGLPFLSSEEFELLGEVGRGGLATVWAARQKLLNRMVAIKVLRPNRDPDLNSDERFLREARLYTQIKSPYVVELFDVRVERGQMYLILELVTGSDVRTLVSSEVLVVPQAMKIAEDIARGLAAIHALEIVHRDVKPGNILLTKNGKAKLTDLGLAKVTSDEELTYPGQGLGTLAYIPPEQATEARTVTFKADLYSLGATLYHLLAGRPPLLLRGKGIAKRIEGLHTEVPRSLTSMAPDCPLPVDEFVLRLLAKNPDDRPGTAEEVADQLRSLRRAHFPQWVPPSTSVTRKTGAFTIEGLEAEVG